MVPLCNMEVSELVCWYVTLLVIITLVLFRNLFLGSYRKLSSSRLNKWTFIGLKLKRKIRGRLQAEMCFQDPISFYL